MADKESTAPGTGLGSLGKRSRPPRLREIADYLRLSPATVSMVINDVPLAKSLSAETRARVLEAAKLFNYRPNLIARSLSKRETRTIGVIAPDSSDGYFTRVMLGVESALLGAGYLYFTASHLGREDLIREYPLALLQRGVDGLVFINTPIVEPPGVPSVCITHNSQIEDITSVLVDQREGMRLALKHLCDLGHRRILMMRGQPWSLDADERYASMLAAAEEFGLPTTAELQITLSDNHQTHEVAYRAFRSRLEAGRDFTAVFAFNDLAAVGVIRCLDDAGLSCPEDVSVIGVDDISVSAYLRPRLSTVAQPLEDMGMAAVDHLIAHIQRPDDAPPQRVLFPMQLQIRESTGVANLGTARRPTRRAVPRAFAETSATAPVFAPPTARGRRPSAADAPAEH